MMPSLPASLYLARKSSAPEKATWVMYFWTSSPVMPMPLSSMLRVRASLSVRTTMRGASSLGACPREASFWYLEMASAALEIISLKKISLSEYSHFLMTGMIFWEWI